MTDQTTQTEQPKTEATHEAPHSFYEEISVAGVNLLKQVQELIQQGNVRRLIIKEPSGRTLIEVPLTIGVVAGTAVAMAAPILAAIGGIAALVAKVTIVVERYENPADAEKEKKATTIEVKPSQN